ncbi:oxidoreductase [Exiguobacterium sp. KRL4]|uniref:globin domain-containing protein n=1 Tax=Exiguobacterium sp. KRL4 TaxID=1914536 RepID=UPI0008F7FD21|nr:globin domain-containing protein [Exiguobacterium sp. KRL4]OIN65927.1 oxidoreductase [Exiguobacterium sp. KRL4]
MLTSSTIAIIKSTVPVLAEHGHSITRVFYQRLFANHPEMKHIFNQSNQKNDRQSQALATAVYAAAAHIDRLEELKPTLLPVLHKHRSLQIKPFMYDIVGTELIGAIQDVLGDAATPDIIDAWTIGYGEIANLFISLEAELYKQDEHDKAFVGYQPFLIDTITTEASDIKTFKLIPADGRPLPTYLAGQYVTVRLQAPDGLWQNRQYSLTKAADEVSYEIAVKQDGSVSGQLHDLTVGDSLLLSAPAGQFILPDSGAPFVGLAGGIGLTPLLAMAEAALADGRPVTLHVAVQDDLDRPFTSRLNQFETFGASVVRYAERNAQAGTRAGRLTRDELTSIDPAAETFVCGPEAMIQFVRQHWTGHPDNLYYEVFGPSLALAAPTVVS